MTRACPPGRIRHARKPLAGSVHSHREVPPGARASPSSAPATTERRRSRRSDGTSECGRFAIYLTIILGTALIYETIHAPADRLPYARFRDLAETGQIADVEIRGDTYVAKTQPDAGTGAVRTYRTGRIKEGERDLLARLEQHSVPYTMVGDDHAWFTPSLLWLLPIGATILILALSARKGAAPTVANPALSFGKNKARLYVDKGAPVTFGDVAGSEEAKAELAEVVEFLKIARALPSPRRRACRGACSWSGPPGTGKTLLAKAVAGEAGGAVLQRVAAPSSSRCSSAWAPRASAICSPRRGRSPPASSSSTSSTRWARRAGSADPSAATTSASRP